MITRLGQLGTKLNEILKNHDKYIIHTGSYQGEQKSIDNPERYLLNVQNTFNYLEQARKENKIFVYISTWDEANNPYVESKRTCERLVLQWKETYGLKIMIIRIPSIIGRGVIHKFIETKNQLTIQDRELEFDSLDHIANQIKTLLEQPEKYENDGSNLFRLKGKKVSAQLLYDIIRYTVKKVQA